MSEVVGRKLSWDKRKSRPQKGDFWALCPFHSEKSASFHVDDRRGVFYCFGCHAKGDQISFLRELDGMSFLEAVEAVAGMAGLDVPRDAGRPARQDADGPRLNEAAVAYFRDALKGPGGADALAYLRSQRGLSDETIDSFEIGFAPNDGRAILSVVKEAGGSWEDAVSAGLATWSEGDKAPFAVFRNRVIFPIRDTRGRCIGFGGRAMAAGSRAKYLNTPETAWFDKSRTLYNHGAARTAAARTGRLILVEGYMDVIGLTQAGIEGVAAPLGTAVTPDHLEHAWRMADEPVIALDGDSAGVGAALRTADVALPLVSPGKSLRFAVLPAGMDPDDMVRNHGADGFQRAVDAAHSMAEMLWRRETYGGSPETPERRAALDVRLRQLVETIEDEVVRGHYRMEFADRRAGLYERMHREQSADARAAEAGVRGRLIGRSLDRRGRDWVASTT